jgi:hypothetical protein
MQTPLRGVLACAVALIIPATTTCWFSSTSPKPGPSTSEQGDPSAAVVTGLVQLFDRTDHHRRTMPGWAVKASWYVRSGSGNPLKLEYTDVVVSGRDGVYEVRWSHPRLAAVDLQGRICEFDPTDLECCIDDPPCNRPACKNAWTPASRLEVTTGSRQSLTLTVGCNHVP